MLNDFTPLVFRLFSTLAAMPLFDGDDIQRMLSMASVLCVNEYEGSVVSQRTGLSMPEIAARLQAVIVTHGSEGAVVYERGDELTVKAVTADSVVDPTGCGDAHRAGLLYGLTRGWSLEDACKLGNVMGSIKVASRGPQTHRPTRHDINAKLQAEYGIRLQ